MRLHYSPAVKGDPSCHVKMPQPKQVSFAKWLQEAYGFPEEKDLCMLFSISLKLMSGPEAQVGKTHGSSDRSGHLFPEQNWTERQIWQNDKPL